MRVGFIKPGASGPPPAGSTWNPADKNAVITLSGGDLTATRTAALPANGALCRGTLSHNAGKWYFEQTINSTPGGGNTSVGIALAAASLNLYLGQDISGIGWLDGGNVRLNAAIVAGIGAYSAGSIVQVAVDIPGLVIWFRLSGGNWNNNPANNPATGVGGLSFAAIGAGNYFPAMSGDVGVPNSVTANFGATAFVGAVPAGFTAWG